MSFGCMPYFSLLALISFTLCHCIVIIKLLSNSSNSCVSWWMKHLEIDYHIVREKLLAVVICTLLISSSNQPTDILTNTLSKDSFLFLYVKLDICDLHALTWGGVITNILQKSRNETLFMFQIVVCFLNIFVTIILCSSSVRFGILLVYKLEIV